MGAYIPAASKSSSRQHSCSNGSVAAFCCQGVIFAHLTCSCEPGNPIRADLAASTVDLRVTYINAYEDNYLEVELAPAFAPFAAILIECTNVMTLAPKVFTEGATTNASTGSVVYLTVISSTHQAAAAAGRHLVQTRNTVAR